jgi:predicted ATPase
MEGMITRIEIDGYKSFEKFALDLEPFTVIAGINGVGKSNLFDALKLLSNLVDDKTLSEAFETPRGSRLELFTIKGNESEEHYIHYAIEVFLSGFVVDDFGGGFNLNYNRIRYEISIKYTSQNGFKVIRETLKTIKPLGDFFLNKNSKLGSEESFLSDTISLIETDGSIATIFGDVKNTAKRSIDMRLSVKTALSSVNTVEFAHALAVKKLIHNIHFLHLDPHKLRLPTNIDAPARLSSSGEGLAVAIANRTLKIPNFLEILSNDIAGLISNIDFINIEYDNKRQEVSLSIKHTDGSVIPGHMLSDGTLRILAMLVISYDPLFNGVILIEEPENGVHPGILPDIVHILEGMCNIDPLQNDGRIRQVILSTHSSLLLKEVDEKNIVMAVRGKKVSGKSSYYTTEMFYVDPAPNAPTLGKYAKEQLRMLLESGREFI